MDQIINSDLFFKITLQIHCTTLTFALFSDFCRTFSKKSLSIQDGTTNSFVLVILTDKLAIENFGID
jgi:hypothetical protein